MPARLSYDWLYNHLLSLDWQSRHDDLERLVACVGYMARNAIHKEVVSRLSPSDLVNGKSTGLRPPPPGRAIVLKDGPLRTKRQLLLTDIFEQQRKMAKHG